MVNIFILDLFFFFFCYDVSSDYVLFVNLFYGVFIMSDTNVQSTKNSGLIAGIIACVLAVLGILFLGVVFVPLAAIVALIGTIIAVKNRNIAGIGVNVLAWVLTFIGLATSPLLLALIGIGSGM